MPLTIEEYHQKWRDGNGPYSTPLESNSAIVDRDSFYSTHGPIHLQDFGHLICFCRYQLPDWEFEPPKRLPPGYDLSDIQMLTALWERKKPRFQVSVEELVRRYAALVKGFDELLEEFVRHGYYPEMGERLLEIANANFLDSRLSHLYILPDDLEELLEFVGNPLVDPNAEDEEAARAAAPPFDLNNPEHREALSYRIQTTE
ncbi:MAG TPA: hypothetical protein VFU69_11740 [Ktedonobacterales bacterium]|nr:hypothetical protein [Ktedonobacterales bacterium]